MRLIMKQLTFETIMRIIADIVIVNISYFLALIVRLLWKIATDPSIPAQGQVIEAVYIYESTFWLVTLIALISYAASGLYSRARFYQARFKALVIFQAVSLAYLLFGFALYLALARGWLVQPPRLALFLSWLLTLSVMGGARLWANLWRRVVESEGPTVHKRMWDKRIHHILVIGGAGYIGSVLCRQLLKDGYSVRVLDALMYGRESLAELIDDLHFELVEGDSRDVSAVFRAMLGMDAVIHLGELVGDPVCALDERLTREINLTATRMVAEAARGCGVKRFIYASSCSVYGAGTEILDERSALTPVSLYAKAKIGSEQMLLGLNGSDFHPVILRLATVYGLSLRPRFDLVVNMMTAKAVCNHEITVFGGDQWRPFVHVEDVAWVIIRCLQAPLATVKGQILNVGSDKQNYTIAQVAELVQSLIPQASVMRRGEDTDRRDYHVSFAKIRRELGFEPRYSIEDGVREIQAAIMAGHIKDFQDKRYNNYQTLNNSVNHLSIRARHLTELYSLPEVM